MSNLKVVIIGGGTGGLCLAHGLRRAGLDVAVYERDRTRRDGLHGYRVGISPDGSRALHACLPPELYATFVATCARAPRSLTFLDEHLHTLLSLGQQDGLDVGNDPVESEKSVSRMTLRQVLLTGLDDVVHFDKTFDRYQVRADGTVEVYFEDGSMVIADLLVGADGSNSRVRRQLLPAARLQDTGIVGVAGKVLLTDEVKSLIAPAMWNGVALLFAPRGYSLVTHTMEFKWDRNGVKSGVGQTDAELIEKWPGLLFDNTSDYFMWGFAGSRQRLQRDPMPLAGAELIELVLEHTTGWHPNLRRLFALSDPSATFPLGIRTSVPVEAWETGPVTLLGDAIHTMTPGRGVGANTALLDALLLSHQLEAVRSGRLGQRDAVADYEQAMRQYGFEAVQASLEQMTANGPMHHPLWGAPALGGMKAMFRVMNALPPIKRRMAEGQVRLRDRRQHPALAAVGV
jgi:2-polyprenyl-6-methoxyphenol hydroxylase-like FAD-dependent oxidoreductase